MTKPALWMGTALILASCATSHAGPDGRDGGSSREDVPVTVDAGAGSDAPDGDVRRDTPDTPTDVPLCILETCDRFDQDCDGLVDEEAECSLPSATSTCTDGACVLGTCEPGFADCDGEPETGCEVSTSTDRTHCGGCGIECGLTERCDAGTCIRERILDVAPGGFMSCALLESSRVLCWGSNEYGSFGPEYVMGESYPSPVEIHGLPTDLVSLSRTTHASGFAFTSTGEVWGWGTNAEGNLGIGTMSQSEPPQLVANGVGPVLELESNYSATCATDSLRQAWCWGDYVGSVGLMGRPTPSAAGYPAGVRSMSGIGIGWVAMTSDDVVTFGRDVAGLRGSEPEMAGERPVRAFGLPFANAQTVTCAGHCCAGSASGAVSCWGSDLGGALGDGAPHDATWGAFHDPSLVEGLPPGWTELVAMGAPGYSAGACARYENGEVWCWGGQRAVALGHDATVPERLPLPPGGASGLYGNRGGCVRLRDETQLRCWGDNWWGELGDGTAGTPSPAAVPVLGFE